MAQDPSQVREEIARDREELAETVQALVHKADVPGRVRETVGRSTGQLQQRVRDAAPGATLDGAARTVQDRPLPFIVAAAVMAGLLVGWMIRRRR